jgi:hypothetical protein
MDQGTRLLYDNMLDAQLDIVDSTARRMGFRDRVAIGRGGLGGQRWHGPCLRLQQQHHPSPRLISSPVFGVVECLFYIIYIIIYSLHTNILVILALDFYVYVQMDDD